MRTGRISAVLRILVRLCSVATGSGRWNRTSGPGGIKEGLSLISWPHRAFPWRTSLTCGGAGSCDRPDDTHYFP